MAVGLACAGSGLKDAVSLLEPMLSDAVDFVRQVCLTVCRTEKGMGSVLKSEIACLPSLTHS